MLCILHVCIVCMLYTLQFTTTNNHEVDEQCLAYPLYNDKDIVRVKVESTIEQANKKAHFEPRSDKCYSVHLQCIITDMGYMDCLAGI